MRFLILLVLPFSGCITPSDRSHGEDARIAIVSGNQQGAAVRQPLAQPLTAGVFDDRGRPVSDARIAWRVVRGDGLLSEDTTVTSDSGLARVEFTVSSAPGIDSVRAGLVGSADAVTFAAAAGEHRSPWPNEPTGFTTLTDWPYNTLVTQLDGSHVGGANVWNQTPGSGMAVVLADPAAPLSPPNVLELVYPVGLPSGLAPWTLYFNPEPDGREFYAGFWWKANASWQGDPSGINKIIFWQDAAPSSANLIMMMNNQRQHDYVLTVTVEFNQATNGHLANVSGEGRVWHLFGNVHGNYVVTPDPAALNGEVR